MPVADRVIRPRGDFERILTDVLRKAGWRLRRHSSARDMGADLVFDAKGQKYVVELKVSSEGRRDRLIPLLSQAILQAQECAQRSTEPTQPLAVVAAKHVSASVAEQIQQFARRYAPEVGVGVIDAEGFRSFAGTGLEGLDAKSPRRVARHIASAKRLPDLFSDLNQWMLKILLGQRLPESLLSIPRGQLRNAFQLAEVARVSVMSASRLVNQLINEGFVDEHEDHLCVTRVDELLERWLAANRQRPRDIPAHWIIKGDDRQFLASVAQYASESKPDSEVKARVRREVVKMPSRCCIGLFAAADALGLGFVRGVPPHLYLEHLDLDVLQRMGLSIEGSERGADVYIRVPSKKESIFRAAVVRGSLPVSDALQVWLDTSAHPARGQEQADEIRRRVLKPLLEKQR
jgi:hypothetical protein